MVVGDPPRFGCGLAPEKAAAETDATLHWQLAGRRRRVRYSAGIPLADLLWSSCITDPVAEAPSRIFFVPNYYITSSPSLLSFNSRAGAFRLVWLSHVVKKNFVRLIFIVRCELNAQSFMACNRVSTRILF